MCLQVNKLLLKCCILFQKLLQSLPSSVLWPASRPSLGFPSSWTTLHLDPLVRFLWSLLGAMSRGTTSWYVLRGVNHTVSRTGTFPVSLQGTLRDLTPPAPVHSTISFINNVHIHNVYTTMFMHKNNGGKAPFRGFPWQLKYFKQVFWFFTLNDLPTASSAGVKHIFWTISLMSAETQNIMSLQVPVHVDYFMWMFNYCNLFVSVYSSRFINKL